MNSSMDRVLKLATADEVGFRRSPVDAETLTKAGVIVREVQTAGEAGLRRYAEQFGEVAPGAELVLGRAEMNEALRVIPNDARAVLENAAVQIRAFSAAQRDSLRDLDVPVVVNGVEIGRAGHRIVPVDRAGCYAPGGRYPLPSSVLMTAITARVAGVSEVVVASPRPTAITLAAAAIADADRFLVVGGAHAIAAMAFGIPPTGAREGLAACDIIVGPGNRWVTAAKQLVSGVCAIDMLAGPSEVLVIADDSGDPEIIAADLLAQAEHDPDAVPLLVTTSRELADRVDSALARQMLTLSTAATAREALKNGSVVIVGNVEDACRLSDRLAPEHLELMVRNAALVARKLKHFGALFVGSECAEVLGDYGLGPNHVLPTGGSARHSAGLSVLTFLRARTWLSVHSREAGAAAYRQTAAFARLEGLEAHARAAEARLAGQSKA